MNSVFKRNTAVEQQDVRKLIINADDFGLTNSCTEAIYEAYRRGMITDTTMVANGNAQETALRLLRNDTQFADCIGIHFNLTEGRPLTEKICHQNRLVAGECFTGYFRDSRTNFLPLTPEEKKAVREELEAQMNKLTGLGARISHADSHHHVHTNLQLCGIFSSVMKQYGIRKCRLHKNAHSYDRIHDLVWNSYNRWLRRQFITTDYMGGILDYTEPYEQYDGIMEIMVHPDYDAAGTLVDRSGLQETGRTGKAVDLSGPEECIAVGMDLLEKIRPLCSSVSGRICYQELT